MSVAAAPPSILAPFVASPDDVVARLLDIAGVGPGDVVYDLGCGDGRIAIAAARRGARAWGCDIEPYRVDESRRNAAAAGVAERATFELADAMSVDVAPATVVALYLVEWSTRRLGIDPSLPRRSQDRAPARRFESGCHRPVYRALQQRA